MHWCKITCIWKSSSPSFPSYYVSFFILVQHFQYANKRFRSMQIHFSLSEKKKKKIKKKKKNYKKPKKKKKNLKFARSVSFMQNEWPLQINDQAITKHFSVLVCIHNLICQSVLNKANAPTLFLLQSFGQRLLVQDLLVFLFKTN